MNVLIFTNNGWDEKNSLGNTISNFFDGSVFKNDIFYNIYMRECAPNNDVCKNYYKMTVQDIIKNHFHKEKIGKSFTCNNNGINNSNREQNMISIIHKHSLKFVYSIVDYFYRRKKWLNKNFKEYIKKADPDIFFSFATNVIMLKPIVEYIKNNTNAKIVLFIADDVYGAYDKTNIFRRKKLKRQFEEIIKLTDKVYGASKELCDYYSRMFNKKIDVLYKGCNFDYPIKNQINNVIKFVYAGNLLYGRDNILSKIALAIDNNNKNNYQKAILEIYSNTTITEELKGKLNIKNSSIIMGSRKYKEIKKIMNEADCNLQVESFEKKQIELVKYSFSTKIIDCLQSGSSVLAIGPSRVSSIKYLKKVPGVLVIDNLDDIDRKIKKIINNKNDLNENARKIREYSLNNHNIEKNQKNLRDDFKDLNKEKKR